MTALRCTQKLLTAMKVKPAAPPSPGSNVLGDWSLTLLHVRPAKLVLAVSEHHRLALVLEAAPYSSLPQRLQSTLFAQLLGIDVSSDIARRECDAMQPLTITATTPYPNRLSLQANLKDYAWQVEFMLEERGSSLAEINACLADHIVGVNKKMGFPRKLVLAALTESCEDESTQENHDDFQTTATTRPALEPVAGAARRRGKRAGGVSPTGAEVHVEFDGAGKRGGQPAAAGTAIESTRPLDATRELATAAGTLTYSEVAERVAVNIAHCLDALLENNPEDIRITPEWILDIHRHIAGDLFPEWAGRFRTTDVQVGSHLPPPGYEVAVHIKNFCLDLDERLLHVHSAETIAVLLAWADWRFQWIHPFKDFNGRTGRILLIAMAYKLALPPVDPAPAESGRAAYFAALRAADVGDLTSLTSLWLGRLQVRGMEDLV